VCEEVERVLRQPRFGQLVGRDGPARKTDKPETLWILAINRYLLFPISQRFDATQNAAFKRTDG
jgi:hypothetical protein